jgi:hypothetical protein
MPTYRASLCERGDQSPTGTPALLRISALSTSIIGEPFGEGDFFGVFH